MVSMETIKNFCDQVVREFKPVKVALFGSYAAGNPTEDSDVDILVVIPFKGKAVRKSLEILNRVNPRFPIDLLVRSPEQVSDRMDKNDFFMREVIEKGKTLYEASDSGMGKKGGRGLRQRVA